MNRIVHAALRNLRTRVLSRRAGVAAATVVLLAVPLAVAAQGKGFEPSRLPLSGGGAWLASVPQGIVTLIDGASEQVIGSVRAPGAQRKDAVSVVQSGSSAYVVNGTQGTVARVDGGTYEVSDPIRFGAGGSLEVLAGEQAVYVMDGSRRVASLADPKTLRVRDRLSLAAQPGPGQSVVDSAGRLWVIDRQTGGLTWFDGGKRVRPGLAGSTGRLLLAGGRPVLVDPAGSRLGPLSADGTVDRWSCLEVRANDQAQLLGSAGSARVFAAVPATGTLVASSLGRDDCNLSVEVGKAGDRYGPLAESAGFVFVPNWSSGHTFVVDVAAGRVAADLTVGRPGSRLELLAKDGFVFYNDLDGDKAGVIRFDGGQWRLGKALTKFERSDSGKGLLTPAGDKADDPAPEAPDAKDGAKPADQPATEPESGPQNRPDDADDDLPTPPDENPDPVDPPPGEDPPPGGDPPPTKSPPPAAKKPVIRDITWTPDPVVRWQAVTFTGTVDNAAGATWAWTLTGEDGTVVHTSAQAGGFTVTPQPGHGTEFTIALDVRGPGGAATPMTKSVQTTSELTPSISSLVASPRSPGVGQQVTFTGKEDVAGDRGNWRWFVTDTGTGQDLTGPVVQEPGQPYRFTFEEPGRYRVRLSVDFDGASDERAVTVTVADRCALTRVTASAIDLRNQASATARVRLTNCFQARTVSVQGQGWLRRSDSSITIQPGGTGQVTVSLDGTPPQDGTIDDVLVFLLVGRDSRVSFNVRVNIAPVWNNYATCVPGSGKTTFYADFTDANVAGLTVTMTVGGRSRQMDYTNGGGSGHGEFFWLEVPTADLPDVSQWTVRAVDDGGLRSDVGTGSRGSCW